MPSERRLANDCSAPEDGKPRSRQPARIDKARKRFLEKKAVKSSNVLQFGAITDLSARHIAQWVISRDAESNTASDILLSPGAAPFSCVAPCAEHGLCVRPHAIRVHRGRRSAGSAVAA